MYTKYRTKRKNHLNSELLIYLRRSAMNMCRKVKLVCKSTFKNTVDFEGERYQLSKKWHIILYLCGLLLTVFPYLTTLIVEKLMGSSWDNAYFLVIYFLAMKIGRAHV